MTPAALSDTHRISLRGVTLVPDLSGALYAPEFHTLLIADLHLEQGASLARRGVHVPPFDTAVTLAQLEALLAEVKPWRLALLGDSFHDDVAHAELDASLRERIAAITGRIETIWISGNHDPSPHGLGGVCVTEHMLGPITLRHIPLRKLGPGAEISGHLHPGATVVHRGVATRAKCFAVDPRRIILPAFGAYTGAVNIRSKIFDGLFDEAEAQAFMLGKSLHRFAFARCS